MSLNQPCTHPTGKLLPLGTFVAHPLLLCGGECIHHLNKCVKVCVGTDENKLITYSCQPQTLLLSHSHQLEENLDLGAHQVQLSTPGYEVWGQPKRTQIFLQILALFYVFFSTALARQY